MQNTIGLRLAAALALAGALAGCQTAQKPLPVMSVTQWEALPADRKPTVFRDSDPNLGPPYDVHETDGLSRNPDDCVRWGCIDVSRR